MTWTDEQAWQAVTDATDREWSVETGMCGGCGSEACHDGPCAESMCRRCPDRIAEGWFCADGCDGRHVGPERADGRTT